MEDRYTRVSSQGHLEFGGCDVVSLARKYGTPLYVMNEDLVRSNARRYLKALSSCYPSFEVIYAGKAFLPMWMCHVVREEGLYLDVSSGGELYTALRAGYPPKRILFHGSNKSAEEIQMALDAGVGRFVVDNNQEISILSRLGAGKGIRPDVLLRVAPGVEAHTHSYIETGQLDSKFGFGLENGQAFLAVKSVLESGTLNLKGLHCHIGSQITDPRGPIRAAERMVEFMTALKTALDYDTCELNLGGGLGITYGDTDQIPSIESYVETLAAAVIEAVEKANRSCSVKLPHLCLEPGRSIVGEAGITLYTVGAVKDVPGVRKYVSVDGGMADNPRPALYGAVYRAVVANKATVPPSQTVCLCGKCCESDVLISSAHVPDLEPGDTVAVFGTGAYCYSMASNYNMLRRPAVVAVSRGRSRLVVRRQSYDDLLAWDVAPERPLRAVGSAISAGTDHAL